MFIIKESYLWKSANFSKKECLLYQNKLGYFYVTAWSIVEKGYNKNFAAQLLEKWLRYWQWPTKLAIEAPSWCLKFFVVLTLLLPTGVLPKKNSAQMVEKWLKYWQWPTKLAIEAPTWSLNFFESWHCYYPLEGYQKKFQLNWLRNGWDIDSDQQSWL